jgi:hypothetical protein
MYVPEDVLDVCPNRLVCWWLQLSEAQRQRIVEDQPDIADEVADVLSASQARSRLRVSTEAVRVSTDTAALAGFVVSPKVSNGTM